MACKVTMLRCAVLHLCIWSPFFPCALVRFAHRKRLRMALAERRTPLMMCKSREPNLATMSGSRFCHFSGYFGMFDRWQGGVRMRRRE
jgi:hypothetical protein